MADDKFNLTRLQLEQALVRQFRLVQEMLALAKKEREALLHDPDLVLKIVEDKEALLDKMGLLEDERRKFVQELSLLLDLRSDDTSIQELLPHFKADEAGRIKNLSEGITSLASQARELNHANHALALSKLEWLKATQSFLIGLFQPETGYRARKNGSQSQDSTGLGVEFRV